ncbi:MAG: hypothetical protein AcusKO_29390 [Acuticoccus sp.]
MPIEAPAERAAMIADWGGPVTYTAAGAPPLTLNAIPDAGFVEAAERFGTGVVTSGTAITLASADLPAGAARGDAVLLDGEPYRVTEVHPDGTGITHVFLEHA